MDFDRVIFIISCIASLVVGLAVDAPNFNMLRLYGIWGCLSLALSIYTWKKRGNDVISPYIVFLVVLYTFSMGQSLLYAINVVSDRDLDGFWGITSRDIFEGEWLSLCMLSMFHVGALCVKDKVRITDAHDCNQYDISNNKLKSVGWFLFIISVYFYVKKSITDLVFSLTFGYGALYERTADIGIAHIDAFFVDLFIPSLLCLYISYNQNKRIRNFVTSIFVFNILTILMTGGRSNAVILISILLILYNTLIRKFNKRDFVFIGIGGIVLLSVLSFISSTRNDAGRSFSNANVEVSNNAAFDAVAEMGSSMMCLIWTEKQIPAGEDYRYGKTYLYSFTTIIPNLGFWDIHPAKKESNMGDWLTEKIGVSFGTGYSMCAEAYANFGYLGILAFFFLGYFFAYIFGLINTAKSRHDYVLLAFLLIIFWFALKLPRNSFINIIRPFFYYAGPIYLYCKRKLT